MTHLRCEHASGSCVAGRCSGHNTVADLSAMATPVSEWNPKWDSLALPSGDVLKKRIKNNGIYFEKGMKLEYEPHEMQDGTTSMRVAVYDANGNLRTDSSAGGVPVTKLWFWANIKYPNLSLQDMLKYDSIGTSNKQTVLAYAMDGNEDSAAFFSECERIFDVKGKAYLDAVENCPDHHLFSSNKKGKKAKIDHKAVIQDLRNELGSCKPNLGSVTFISDGKDPVGMKFYNKPFNRPLKPGKKLVMPPDYSGFNTDAVKTFCKSGNVVKNVVKPVSPQVLTLQMLGHPFVGDMGSVRSIPAALMCVSFFCDAKHPKGTIACTSRLTSINCFRAEFKGDSDNDNIGTFTGPEFGGDMDSVPTTSPSSGPPAGSKRRRSSNDSDDDEDVSEFIDNF